ncbi:MAG: putative TIM-barrel fold metal-dependent hydrolase [Frankiales bacterium]|nr:putative TIM-barrel fold metal-dependent hydrolase [Frankiales bacterium]
MTQSPLAWPIYDADQHYYEAADSFTRHLNPEYSYAFRWVTAQDTGRTHLLVADSLFTMIPNPTFNPVGKPGALAAYFRGENTEGTDFKKMMGKMEPTRVEYQNRDARVKVLESQGVAGALMLPTLALGLEQLLLDDPRALDAVLHAFNAWIDEEWGFARGDQIVAPPVLSLMDPALAEKELQWLIERGTKAVILRPGPVVGPHGRTSPGDKSFDRIWAMCVDADVAVAFHAADSGYNARMAFWGESAKGLNGGNIDSPLADILCTYTEAPITETLAAFIAHGALDRHPELRLVTIELGSGWVPDLLRRLKNSYGKQPHLFKNDPVERFHHNVWVAPFQEDSISGLADVMNIDHILFGSDWPHPEGNENPADAIVDFADLTVENQRKVMSDNLKQLLKL